MHYDVSGPGADNVELIIYRLLSSGSGKMRELEYTGLIESADGFHEVDFVQDVYAF